MIRRHLLQKIWLLFFLVGYARCRITREDLAALRAVDATGEINNLSPDAQLALLDSFLEVDNSWWRFRRSRSRWYSPPPPPPPRRRHSACECDMPQQDAFTTECLNRRFQLLISDYSAVLSDTAYGFTVEGSRAVLRTPQAELEKDYNVVHGNATQLLDNVTNAATGYVGRAERQTKHLLSMEYFWALSVNNAYMNMLRVSGDQFMGNVENIETLQDTLMEGTATWFSGLQTREENTTNVNLKTIANISDNSTNDMADKINAALAVVYDSINGLSATMNSSNLTVNSLRQSISTLSNTVSGTFTNISTRDIPSVISSTGTKIGTAISYKVKGYNSTASSIVSGFVSASGLKQGQYSNTSLSSINNTNVYQRGALGTLYNSSLNSIGLISNTIYAIPNTTWNASYGPIANQTATNISTWSSKIASFSQLNKGIMSYNSKTQLSLESQLGGIVSKEKSLVASAGSNSTKYRSNATTVTNQIVGSTISQMNEDLSLSKSIGLSAPEAVGSETFSNLDEMSAQVSAVDSQLGDAANSAAYEASFMGAALTDVAREALNALASAGNSVSSSIGASSSATMNEASDVGSALAKGAVAVPSASSALSTAQASALAAVQARMNELVLNGTMNKQADAQTMTSQILQALQKQGIAADDAIVALRAYIAQTGPTNKYTANFANQTDDMIGTYLSGSATSVYNTEVQFTSQMQTAIDSFKKDLSMSSTTSSDAAAAAAASKLADIEKFLDASSPLLDTSSFSMDTKQLDSSVNNQTGYVTDTLNGTVLTAEQRVAAFLASSSSSVSDTTTSRMSQMQSLKASSNISIGGITVDQMDQIRAVAANFDSLMRQVNNYIGSQNTPLYNMIVNLPNKGHRMMQQIRAFKAAVYAIQRGDPLGMDDLVKFGVNPDPDISDLSHRLSENQADVQDQLPRVSMYFNRSSQDVLNDITMVMNAYSESFKVLVANLQNTLASADSAAQSEESNILRDGGILSVISDLSAQIQNLANLASSQSGGTNGLNIPYPALSSLMSSAASIVNNASVASSSAAQIVGQLGGAASGVSQQLGAVNDTSIVNQLKLRAASFAMQSGLLLSQISKSQSGMNQTQVDAMSVINSYANQAAVSAAILAQKGESVSDAVLAAQANVATAMGRIAQTAASFDMSTQIESQSDQIRGNLNVLRSTLSQMMAAFDAYLASQRMRFTGALNQLNSTNSNVMFNVGQKLTAVDMGLDSDKTLIAQDIADLQTSISWFGNDADLKIPADSLRTQLQNWYSQKMNEIGDELSEIQSISPDNSVTVDTVEGSLSSAIESMAAQAVSMIQSYQLPVPSRLEDYASNGIEAITR